MFLEQEQKQNKNLKLVYDINISEMFALCLLL